MKRPKPPDDIIGPDGKLIDPFAPSITQEQINKLGKYLDDLEDLGYPSYQPIHSFPWPPDEERR